jgi:hypothetical protein
VERGIEHEYKTLLLTEQEQTLIREVLLAHVEINAQQARNEADRHARRLRELTAEQQKLVQLYYKKAVSEEVLKAEQERIQTESAAVERWATAAKREVDDVNQALSDALALIDLGTAPYLIAQPLERRIINLAIYNMLLVSHPDTVEADPSELYALLVPTARQLAQEPAHDGQNAGWPDQQSPGNRPQNDHDPVFRGRSSQYMQMAERGGFEPPNEVSPVTRFPVAPVQPLRHLSMGFVDWHRRRLHRRLRHSRPSRC